MPYSRNDIAAELLSFYQFLVTLHLPDDALRVPPPGGWPQITKERLDFLEKDDSVIDLLKHIAYISDDEGGSSFSLKIFEGSICNDFSGEEFQEVAKGHKFSRSKVTTEPMDEMVEVSEWAVLQDPDQLQYMATIARSAGRNGHYLFCDVRTGSFWLVDFQVGTNVEFGSAKELFDQWKKIYRTLEIFATAPHSVHLEWMWHGDMAKVREIYHRHGWPNSNFRKEECLAELYEM